jgi:hypothetical protein
MTTPTHAPPAKQPIPTSTFHLLILSLSLPLTPCAQGIPEYELPPILYSQTPATNAIEALQQSIHQTPSSLLGTTDKKTLENCLRALHVSPDTQVLLFSKTSLQRRRISPENPRALFFSDDLYLGWVPGGLIEATTSDPALGLAFYSLNPHPDSSKLQFQRDESCLTCHAGPLTRQWPALIIRSIFPDSTGEPIGNAGSFLTDHTSPLQERWGGWYVTGFHGSLRHMGNVSANETVDYESLLDREKGANLTNLSPHFLTSRYPRPDSDILALMILEHQVMVHNRLAEGALRVRRWMHYQQSLQKELGDPFSNLPSGTALKVVQSETQRILEALLFVHEAPLPPEGIQGNSAFPAAFQANRRPDPKNRSLKDLNLKTRLFNYRCSYLIHSDAFSYLPRQLKNSVYLALNNILKSTSPQPPFNHLEDEERKAILEILLATQPDWPRS